MGLIHRPCEEFCTYVWYDAINDDYDISSLEDRLSDNEGAMNSYEIMDALQYIKDKYFHENN